MEPSQASSSHQEQVQAALVTAVLALVNAPTLEESQQVIAGNQVLLFSPETDTIFERLLEQYREDAPTSDQILEQWDLLQLSRQYGIQVAFSDEVIRSRPVHISRPLITRLNEVRSEKEFYELVTAYPFLFRKLTQLGLTLLNSQTREEKIQILQAYPEILLSPGFDYWFSYMEIQFKQDPGALQSLQETRGLLQRIRSQANETASAAGVPAQTTATRPGELPEEVVNILRELVVEPFPDSDIPRRIALIKSALEQLDRERQPEMWAFFQHHWGNYLSDSPHGDRAENLEEAIEHHRLALEIFQRDTHAALWATVMRDLGWDYQNRVLGDPAENRERAIQSYEQALEVATQEDLPEEWARLHSNLGGAFEARLLGNPDQNREKAIEHLKLALNVFTKEAYPKEWAYTQNSLGAAYSERILGQRKADLEKSSSFTFGDSLTWSQDDQAENQEQAIGHYQNALQVITREFQAERWADLQVNLGNLYRKRRNGERKENLAAAIACFDRALQVFNRGEFPLKWGDIQEGIGRAFQDMPDGKTETNREKALEHFRLALEIFSRQALPELHREVAMIVGNLSFDGGDWDQAVEAYRSALEAADAIYRASATPQARRAVVNGVREALTQGSYGLVRLGKPAEAIALLERWLARVFGESLGIHNAAFQGVRELDLAALKAAREQAARLEAESLTAGQPGHRDYVTVSNELRVARDVLQGLQDSLHPEGPELPNLPWITARELDRPLVYLLGTPAGGAALIISPPGEQNAAVDLVWLDQLKPRVVENEVAKRFQQELDRDGGVAAGVAGKPGPLELLNYILGTAMPLLKEWITEPLVTRLQELGFNQAYLIPTRGVGLWSLPAAALPEMVFSYAPSARILWSALLNARQRAAGGTSLCAVGNPLPNPQPLIFAEVEVDEIAYQFPAGRQSVLVGLEAGWNEVRAALPGATHLHFACHGFFNGAEVLDSALLLSGDDRITLHDLLEGDLDLNSARLVVLSACETAITATIDVPPEEALGFPAAFLGAGVPGILSTLWPVDDLSTTLLLRRFYENYFANGGEAPSALAAAQTWLRSATVADLDLARFYEEFSQTYSLLKPDFLKKASHYRENPDSVPFAHPYYWAAFVFYGVSI